MLTVAKSGLRDSEHLAFVGTKFSRNSSASNALDGLQNAEVRQIAIDTLELGPILLRYPVQIGAVS